MRPTHCAIAGSDTIVDTSNPHQNKTELREHAFVGCTFDEAHELPFELVLTGIIDHSITKQLLQTQIEGDILDETR